TISMGSVRFCGYAKADDASTGKLLGEFPTNSGIIGPASSFMVGGKQYIAVESGWGMDPRSIQARLNPVSRQVSGSRGEWCHLGVRRQMKDRDAGTENHYSRVSGV